MKIRQTEFVFPARPKYHAGPVPRGSRVAAVGREPLTPPSPPPCRRGRRATAQTNRLQISPEAFESREEPSRGEGGRREGVLEAVATLLMTVVFGLTWAAVELEQVPLAGSGYDLANPAPNALWDLAAAYPTAPTVPTVPTVPTAPTDPTVPPVPTSRAPLTFEPPISSAQAFESDDRSRDAMPRQDGSTEPTGQREDRWTRTTPEHDPQPSTIVPRKHPRFEAPSSGIGSERAAGNSRE
jgi:hypothetical protein